METQARKDLVEKIKKMQTVYDSAATPETMKAMIKTGIEGANKALEALDAAEKELADAEEEKKKADKEATIARAQAAMKTKAAKTPAAKEKIKAALSPAIEKAKKAMGETKKAKEKIIPAKKAAEKATKSLKTIIAAKPELNKLYAGETEKQLVRDAGRRAMNPGKRTSASGHTYYEKRANRVDLTHKKYPLLEKGGQIPVYEIGDFKVFKRTFEAKKHNVGSDERKKLNENNITSEYMPSYKYAIHGPNFSSSKPGKQEAIDFAEKLSKNFEKGGKVGKEAITYLNISNENPLSSQLQKLTGSIWNQLDFESVDPKQALSTMNPFKHIKTGKVFAVNPPKLAEGGKIKGTKKLVFFDFDHEDDENDFEGTDTLIGKDFTVTNIKWTKGKDDKTSDSYSGYYNSKKSKTNEQIKDDVENKLSEVGSVNYVVTEDEEFKAGGTTGGTMAELKRKLQLGQAIKMVNFFGQTDPNDTNDRAKGRLQKIRYVVKVQTNGVYFSPIKTDKTGSYWEFPPASLIEVTEKGFKVYGPGARELNAEEKKIMANEPKDAEQDRIDMMSDGSTMYYRRKHYYEYEHPQYAYLFNPGWQNKLRFDSNQEKVYDKDVKGPVELEYEFVNEAEFKAGGPVAETMWLSVDESEPFTYEDFYAANNEDPDVDPLTEDQLDAIKALAIGESWSTGGAGDVEIKRVEPPMEMGGELTYKDGTPVHYAVHCSDGRCHIVHRSNGRVLPTNTVFRWTYGNHNRFSSPEAAETALKKMLINLHEENPDHNPEPAFYKPQRKKAFGLFELGGIIKTDKTTGTFAKAILKKRGSRIHDILYVVGNTTKDEETGTFSLTEQGYEKLRRVLDAYISTDLNQGANIAHQALEKMSREDYNKLCRALFTEGKKMNYSYLYERGGRLKKITEEKIEEAINEDYFNEAIIIIQDAIGQDDGGVASIHFSGYDIDEEGNIKEWDDKSNRRKIITDYLETEENYASLRDDHVPSNTSISYHAEVRDWIKNNAPAAYQNVSLDEIPLSVFNDKQMAEYNKLIDRFLGNKNYKKGGQVNAPVISFNKSWSKEGTVYDQRVKIDRDTFNKLKDAVASEIALKYPRKDEYVSTSGYEMYLKPLVCEKENVCYLNNTQTRFINLFLKLKLKNRNTSLYIVKKYEDGGELNNDVDITEDLKNFDLDSLDPLEEMMYNDLIKNSPKEQVLQILINNVEGDYSQLSEKLAELAEKQNPEDSYAKGGQVNNGWVKYGDTYTSKSHNYSVRETSDGLFQVLDNEGFDPIGEGFFTLSQAKKVADQIVKENSEFKAGGEIKTEEDFYNAAVAYLKSAYLLEPNDLFPGNVHDDMADSLKSGETPQDYVDGLANKYDLDKVSSGYGYEKGGVLKYKDGRPVDQFKVGGSGSSWEIQSSGINGDRAMDADSVKYWTGEDKNEFKTQAAALGALKKMLRKMHKENPGYNPAFANGGRVSGEHWFKKAVEDQPPYDLQGWKKDQSAEVRRKHAMDSRPSDMNQHQKLASAGRALQALANVTKDKETKKLAREDAAYFFAAARKQGTKKAANPAIEKAKQAMGKAKKNISTTLFDAIKAEKIKQHNKRVQRYAHYLVVNKKDASYKEKGGAIEGNFVKGIFTIDDEHMYKGYATPGEEWNGWAVPYFEKDEALQILDDTEKPYKWEMKDGVNTLFANLDPEDPDSDYDEVGPIKINVGGKEIETYTPGAYSWVWDTVTIPKGEKLFSWKDKTGRGYNNKRMPLAQILDIENDRNWDNRDLWEWALYCAEGDEWENATSKFECTKDKTERY